MSSYVFSTAKSLFTGRLRIVLVFVILTIAPLISESLLNTRVTMEISLTLIFRESVFDFDICSVSRKFTPPVQKMITDEVILSVVLERTVRLLTTVDVVLEEYNNYLPNIK